MKLSPSISIIVPAYNAECTIEQALRAICSTSFEGLEVIVVDDASTDKTAEICSKFPVRLLRMTRNAGPAHARNMGAALATGEVLLFLDADTCLETGALEKIARAFGCDDGLDGMIGAYDDQPAAHGTISQFRNLLHCFVHRSAKRQASTFWSGCGAIKTSTFLAANGFDESYLRPSIEDLEFGYRLSRAGRKILMDSEIRVKHLKRWTFGSMMQTDVRDRGIPWTQLILRERFMPADLNLGMDQRLSVIGVFLALSLAVVGLFAASSLRMAALTAAFGMLMAVVVINRAFYRFLYVRRGPLFTANAIALHLFFYFYNGVAFVLGLFCWSYRSHPMRELRRRLSEIVQGG
ncbi:MAG TPA: glycosyltransferase family 2 protein [Acidisarcina sp.]